MATLAETLADPSRPSFLFGAWYAFASLSLFQSFLSLSLSPALSRARFGKKMHLSLFGYDGKKRIQSRAARVNENALARAQRTTREREREIKVSSVFVVYPTRRRLFRIL